MLDPILIFLTHRHALCPIYIFVCNFDCLDMPKLNRRAHRRGRTDPSRLNGRSCSRILNSEGVYLIASFGSFFTLSLAPRAVSSSRRVDPIPPIPVFDFGSFCKTEPDIMSAPDVKSEPTSSQPGVDSGIFLAFFVIF